MTKSFKLFLAVALFAASIADAAAYTDGSRYVGSTPKAPTPSPKQQDKEVKSAPVTPRPTK